MTLNEKRIQRRKLWERMKALNDKAAAERRDFTVEEQTQWSRMDSEVDQLAGEIEEGEQRAGAQATEIVRIANWSDKGAALRALEASFGGTLNDPIHMEPESRSAEVRRGSWRTAEGQDVRHYRPGEKMQAEADPEAVGRLVQAILIPDYRSALPKEEQRILQTGSDPGGGYLLGTQVSGAFMQDARDATVVGNMCQWVEVPKGVNPLRIVGVDSMPTATFKAEGAALDEGDVTFLGLEGRPKPLGEIVALTKSLVESSNAAAKVTEVLRYAVAKAIDTAILTGAGGASPTGVYSTAGILSSDGTSTTPLTVDLLSDAYYDLLAANVPDAINAVWNSDTARCLAHKKDGEGRYLTSVMGGVPESWARFGKKITNIIDTTANVSDVYLGNWSEAYVFYRGEVEILATEQGRTTTHNAFQEGKVLIRVFAFVDFGLGRPGWFNVLKNYLNS